MLELLHEYYLAYNRGVRSEMARKNFEGIVKGACRSKIEDLMRLWENKFDREKYGQTLKQYSIELLGEATTEEIEDIFGKLQEAEINRSEFEEQIKVYLHEFEKAEQENDKEIENLQRKIDAEYDKLVKEEFEQNLLAQDIFLMEDVKRSMISIMLS